MTTISLSLALASLAPGGQSDSMRPDSAGAPAVHASRNLDEGITLDGVLAEAGWSTAQPASDFTQREPNEGASATERTEVRVLYDDDALYVGARMYDRSPDSVMAQLARRDPDRECRPFHRVPGFVSRPAHRFFLRGQRRGHAVRWDPVQRRLGQ